MGFVDICHIFCRFLMLFVIMSNAANSNCAIQKQRKHYTLWGLVQIFFLHRLTTLTASYRRSEVTGSLMEGQTSCSSISVFRPSAVQSATIQPQSRVLKGKPP